MSTGLVESVRGWEGELRKAQPERKVLAQRFRAEMEGCITGGGQRQPLFHIKRIQRGSWRDQVYPMLKRNTRTSDSEEIRQASILEGTQRVAAPPHPAPTIHCFRTIPLALLLTEAAMLAKP